MATVFNAATLKARFALFDETNKGGLDSFELANAFRSLGWTDINATHCYNLMQTHFGVGTVAEAEEADAAGDDENEEEEEEENTSNNTVNESSCEKINFAQFERLVRAVEVPVDSPLECYKAYTLMDLTHNGIITDEDLLTIASRLHGSTMSEQQLNRMVNAILLASDSNKDDKLSLPEFRDAIAKGGAGTENGPLDLAALVVDQPSRAEVHERNRRRSKSLSGGDGNQSFTGSQGGSRRSRRNSAVPSQGAYPHSNVVSVIPGSENAAAHEDETAAGNTNTNNAAAHEDDAAAKDVVETFNFEGINVSFHNGRISKDEVEAFFKECGDLLVGADFERWFETEDTDADGYLTEEQFRATLEIFLSDAPQDDDEDE